jgi:hypothetical protein
MIISSYSGGSASAYEYSTFPELLSQLPDNSGNLIDAINVRNSVYTLWQRISQVAASQSASASVTYTNANPTPLTIGGIPAGSTFSNKTMTEMWNALLYPYIQPSASLTVSGVNPREFGASNSVTLNWSVTKGSRNITGITLCSNRPDTQPITPNNNTVQSGTKLTTADSNQTTDFYMLFTDTTPTVPTIPKYAIATVLWSSAVYWGKWTTFSPPMNTFGADGGKPSWADGAGVGSGKKISGSKAADYSGINGAGQYLVFAWPTAYGEPLFKVNGFINNAFTKVFTGNYSNGWSYTRSYDVWVSNTQQNSPIDTFTIS